MWKKRKRRCLLDSVDKGFWCMIKNKKNKVTSVNCHCFTLAIKLQDNINQINTNNKTNINEQWLTDWLKKNNNLNTNDINKIIDDKLNNTLSGAIDQKINNRDFIANLARRGYGTLVQEMKNNAVLEEEEEMNNRYNGCACQ